MTMKVTVTNEGPEGYEATVNVVECQSPADEGQTVERHDLKLGESVTVQIYGWRRYVNVLEMAAREDGQKP